MSSSPNLIDNKDKLTTWLNAIQNSFMVGMAAIYLYEQSEVWPLLEGAELGFVPQGKERVEPNLSIRLPIHFVADRMQRSEARVPLLHDFREFLLRNALAETLEHVREYCEATQQHKSLYAAPWYHFARMIRNALTHDGVIRYDKYSRPPIAFDRWTLNAEDEGRHISESGIASTATVPLLVAIHAFVEKELT